LPGIGGEEYYHEDYGVTAFLSTFRKEKKQTMSSARKIQLVGSRIRELRKGRRLTQMELSEKIGVAQSDLSRMEQGEYKVGLDTLFKILQVFDLKMGEFFGETESPSGEETRDLLSDFEGLSSDAQREVRDFVRFKKLQEETERSGGPDGEEND
jgi:transcriptional regulator with XRE-family HTH domain